MKRTMRITTKIELYSNRGAGGYTKARYDNLLRRGNLPTSVVTISPGHGYTRGTIWFQLWNRRAPDGRGHNYPCASIRYRSWNRRGPKAAEIRLATSQDCPDSPVTRRNRHSHHKRPHRTPKSRINSKSEKLKS